MAMRLGKATSFKAFKNTDPHKNNRSSSSSSSSSRKAVRVQKLPPVAVQRIDSFKRTRCVDYDSEPVTNVGPKTNSAKRQRMSNDIDEDHQVHGAVSCEKISSSDLNNCESPITVLHDYEIELSPRSAARVARLKAQFAVTIVKAKHDLLYGSTKGVATTEAKIKSYRDAEIIKANEFVNKQRQKDREAARLALEEMEKKVVIDDNFKTMREFEMLISGRQL